MRPIALIRANELTWSQPKMSRREFELRDERDVVATLKWHGEIGSLATGELADRAWTLKRAGFLRPRVIIRTLNTTEQIGQYEAGWAGGGRLLYPDGHGYFWRQRSFWKNEWAFEDERGGIVAVFGAEFFIMKRRVHLQFVGNDRNSPDQPLLAILGLYLMILSNDDVVVSMIVATS